MNDVEARIQEEADRLAETWRTDPRWKGTKRDHSAADVIRLRGSHRWDLPLARHAAETLWRRLQGGEGDPYVRALGALTGNQAVQMIKAGLKSIYVSGWQVAADGNRAESMYPDQSLYPADSVPATVRRLNNALQRADQVEWSEGRLTRDWYAPIVADAEAGFGGPLNAYELMKGMIQAGTAGVHFEDQLASEKKCGHMGGKVLVPTSQAVRQLKAARLAADVLDAPTIVIARTDARAARLITSDVDPMDHRHVTGERTPEGYHRVESGMDPAIDRGLAYAPYADLVWCETSTPDLDEAKRFAQAIRSKHPDKLLAYNCSPSFNWRKNLDDETIAAFQDELGRMGYKFQFITLAGFHALNHGMFRLAHEYARQGMGAYVRLQEAEFASETDGYTATKHQREVGTGYYDAVSRTISGGSASTLAMDESTEAEQFMRARTDGGEGQGGKKRERERA